MGEMGAARPRLRRRTAESPAMGLLEDLDAFYLEHRRCGEIESYMLPAEPGACWVPISCTCGARVDRVVVENLPPQ